jgi:hypothetical protein
MTDELKTYDGFSLDLFESIPVPISFSISDIKDPTKRKQSFSKQVDLPDTMNNNAFFQGVFSMTSTDNAVNFDATAKAPIRLFKRGVQVLDGIMKLNEVSSVNGIVKYNVTILSDNADIFQLLTQVSLNELDWSDYNHALTRDNIKDSWLTTAGTGYYYPLIERGLGRPGNLIFRTIDFVPYVYLYECLQKCFDYIGLTWESNFLESSTFKNILFGFGGGDIKSVPPSVLNQRLVNLDDGVYTGSISYINSVVTPTTFNQFSLLNLFDNDTFTYTMTEDTLGQWSDGTITIAESGAYNLTITGILDYVVNYGGFTFEQVQNPQIRVYKNGVFIQTVRTASEWSTTDTGLFNYNTDNSFNMNCQSGDVITFRLVSGSVIAFGAQEIDSVSMDLTTNTDFTIDLTCIDTMISDGDTVDLSLFVPAMRCDEFLLSCIRQFNLYVGEIDSNNSVRIEPLINYYLQTTQFTDITELVDHSKTIKTKPTANDYAKKLTWQFKTVTDYDNDKYFQKWEEQYGDYSFIQGSYYAKGEQKTELAWATIIPYQLAPGILVPRFIKIDGGVIKPNTGAPRIMFRNGLKPGSIVMRDTDTTDSDTVAFYPCVHHFDDWEDPEIDLNYKLVNEVFYTATVVTTRNSYSEYYSQFITEMTSPAGAIWMLSVKWDEYDVKNRDWRRLLMIDGALFRLNEIKEFSADVSPTTEIELVKVLRANKRSTVKVTTDRLPPGILFDDPPIASPSNDTGIDTPVIGSPPRNKGLYTSIIRG